MGFTAKKLEYDDYKDNKIGLNADIKRDSEWSLESERKKNNYYNGLRKKEMKRSKEENSIRLEKRAISRAIYSKKALQLTFASIALALFFSVTALLVFGQVRLTELTSELNEKNSYLAEQESVEIQLQMNLDNSTSLAEVEKQASERLGMQKLSQNQINYIGTTLENQGQVLNPVNESFIERAVKWILGLIG